MKTVQLLTVAAVVAVLTQPVFAQDTGAVHGTVRDQTGQPIPGALIVLVPESGAPSLPPFTTNVSGEFRTRNFILPGRYLLYAEMPGFVKAIRDDVELAAGRLIEWNPVLRVRQFTSLGESLRDLVGDTPVDCRDVVCVVDASRDRRPATFVRRVDPATTTGLVATPAGRIFAFTFDHGALCGRGFRCDEDFSFRLCANPIDMPDASGNGRAFRCERETPLVGPARP